jgi:hypothetical protein
LRVQVLKLRDAIRSAAPKAAKASVMACRPSHSVEKIHLLRRFDFELDEERPTSLVVWLVRRRITELREQARTPMTSRAIVVECEKRVIAERAPIGTEISQVLRYGADCVRIDHPEVTFLRIHVERFVAEMPLRN